MPPSGPTGGQHKCKWASLSGGSLSTALWRLIIFRTYPHELSSANSFRRLEIPKTNVSTPTARRCAGGAMLLDHGLNQVLAFAENEDAP